MNATLWPAGLIAFLFVLLLVPLVRIFCACLQLYDQPGPLKIHARPIPRLGGIAVVSALVLGVALTRVAHPHATWFLAAALALVWLSGLLDDLRGLPPAARLTAQAIAALLVWLGSWGVTVFTFSAMNIAATILYLVLFINAFNFLDGADGIAAGVTAVIAIAYLLLPSGVLRAVGSADAWALLGACAGFLLFNFPPAKIFLGDSGSSVLGFTVALLGLELHRANGPGQAPLLFPLLVASVAILDVILAVVRRLRHGRSPLQGDRRHFYDLLRNTGWPARRIALTCYALTGALVTAGLATLHRGFMLQLVTYLLVTGVLLAIGASLGSLRGDQTHQREPAESEAFWREASASRLRQKA